MEDSHSTDSEAGREGRSGGIPLRDPTAPLHKQEASKENNIISLLGPEVPHSPRDESALLTWPHLALNDAHE